MDNSIFDQALIHLYYNFFYKDAALAYLLPAITAFLVYYVLYIPKFRKSDSKNRARNLTIR